MNKKPGKRLRIDAQIIRSLTVTELGGVVGGAVNWPSVLASCYKACGGGCPNTQVAICGMSEDFCTP